MLDRAQLEGVLPVGRFGAPLYVYHSIESTNDRAAELAAAGAPEGATVLACEQTAGRGRHGRSWDTPAGAGLAASTVLRPPADRHQALGLIGALGVVEALHQYDLRAQVKWPNDVLLGGRKLAGVLVEAVWSGAELEYLVLGIGVNLRMHPDSDSSAYEYPATALEQHLGRSPDTNRFVARLLGGLERWYQRHLEAASHPEWERHLALLGELVLVSDEGQPVAGEHGQPQSVGPGRRGRILGLTPQGGLRLELPDGSEVEVLGGGARIRPSESGLA